MTMPQPNKIGLIYDLRDEPALKRIKAKGEGASDWGWNVMNWFLSLTKQKFSEIGRGDLLNLQDEALAIRRTFGHEFSRTRVSEQQLVELKTNVKKALDDLIGFQRLTLGPFPLIIEIHLPSQQAERDQREHGWISRVTGDLGNSPSLFEPIKVHHRVDREKVLRYEFARQLEKYASSIKRCPHCQESFLQFRPTARYCSRLCQSREIMRRRRNELKKKGKAKRKPEGKA